MNDLFWKPVERSVWEQKLQAYFGARWWASHAHARDRIEALPEHLRLDAALAVEAALRLYVPVQVSDSGNQSVQRCRMIDKVLAGFQEQEPGQDAPDAR
jgi:hypothetical protein